LNKTWICGDCRSLNADKQKRCYKCQMPRASSEMTEATAAVGAAKAAQDVTILAHAARLGAHYRGTWPLAVLVVPLIIAATVLTIALFQAWSAAIGPDGRVVTDTATQARLTTASVWALAALGGALLVWCLWIAMVVRNVPALTARWPPNSPVGAFFAPFIPILCYWRPHSVVRGVLAILSESRSGPRMIALAWWVAVLANYLVPSLLLVGRRADVGTVPAMALALQVWTILLVVAAALAIAVVAVVEREQRGAVKRRANTLVRSQAADGLAAGVSR
jgi:hypothetical protein